MASEETFKRISTAYEDELTSLSHQDDYKDYTFELLWRCKNGHVFRASFRKLYYRNHKCALCRSNIPTDDEAAYLTSIINPTSIFDLIDQHDASPSFIRNRFRYLKEKYNVKISCRNSFYQLVDWGKIKPSSLSLHY